MQAIVRTHYGSPEVLQLTEVAQPVPAEDEVLVQVHAASVNAADWHLMRGQPFLVRMLGSGLRRPKDPRLGLDLAGRVTAVGAKVTQFQVGDEVFGRGRGAFAEYACARAALVALKPANVTVEAAAAAPGAALIALQGLRLGGTVRPGQRVVIQGASGGVGTFALQLAKAYGAEVTAVCGPQNVAMASSLGADHVIDYTQADFTRNGQRYDLIVAVNGYHPIGAYRRALRPSGRFVLIGASPARLTRALFQIMLLGPVLSRLGRTRMALLQAKPFTGQDLAEIRDLLEAGKLVPVVERRYPLRGTAAAIRYLEAGHARGKLVITI
jgi:NADPH:quinone reductase-like Zn-dependent oxidoreductase